MSHIIAAMLPTSDPLATPANNKAILLAAIAALTTMGARGGTIEIPPGEYSVDPGISLFNGQNNITIRGGGGSCYAYEQNASKSPVLLRFTAGDAAFDLSAFSPPTVPTGAGLYLTLENFAIDGGAIVSSVSGLIGGVCKYGVLSSGMTTLRGMNISGFTEAGVQLNEWTNSTSFEHVSLNYNKVGLRAGCMAATYSANTIWNMHSCSARQNVIGMWLEQTHGHAIRDTVIESNCFEGMVATRRTTGNFHTAHTDGLFDRVWFENNGITDNTRAQLRIDAETPSMNPMQTVTGMTIRDCIFTCYKIPASIPVAWRPLIDINCAHDTLFDGCTFQTADGIYTDGPEKAVITLGVNTSGVRIVNTTKSSTFKVIDNGTNNFVGDVAIQTSGTFPIVMTGCTVPINGTCFWTKTGNVVQLDFHNMSGISNSTSKTITGIPAHLLTAIPGNGKSFKPFVSSEPLNDGRYVTGWAQLAYGVITISMDGNGTQSAPYGNFVMRADSLIFNRN